MRRLTAAFVDLLIAVFVRRTVAVGKALHFEAARSVADVTRLALTAGYVIQDRADRVQAAINGGTWIRTIVVNAGLRIRTVSVRGALMWDRATRSYRIARGAQRTRAPVRPMKINTFRTWVTRLVFAFVDIQAVFRARDKSVAASENRYKKKKLQFTYITSEDKL